MSKLELTVVQEQLGRKKSHLVSQDTIDELNLLAEDMDYGEEFLDSYISHFNILDGGKWATSNYMNAMKFFTLMESGNSGVDAYVKVFPERLKARQDRGEGKDNMGGEASRFNSSALVNEIRKVAAIPVQLIHRHLLHEAILKSADIMNDPGVSPAVQQKAAETLIRELKPTEDKTINLNIEGEGIDQIAELKKATQELAVSQLANINKNSVSVKAIAESTIIEAEIDDGSND